MTLYLPICVLIQHQYHSICSLSLAGSGDIVNGNLKLILGLVWTLILHYQISMGFQIDDPNTAQKEGPTARQALLNYVRVCLE